MHNNTRMPVDKLSGRELDAAVAEEVMGWERATDAARGVTGPIYLWVTPDGDELSAGPGGWRDCKKLPHYSTDITTAWRVVGLLLDTGLTVEVRESTAGSSCRVYQGAEQVLAVVDATTTTEAICRAALEGVRRHQHK